MSKYLRERLARIEARVKIDPVVLTMPDGRLHHIRGTARHFLKLFRYVGCLKSGVGERNAQFDQELIWLRDAVRVQEPSGGPKFDFVLGGLVRNGKPIFGKDSL